MSGYADACGRSYAIRIHYVWTQIFLYPHKKNLRIKKSPDTCGLGLMWTIFFDNIFFIIGSFMNAYERELKLSNHDNENVIGKCNLTFLQSFLNQ